MNSNTPPLNETPARPALKAPVYPHWIMRVLIVALGAFTCCLVCAYIAAFTGRDATGSFGGSTGRDLPFSARAISMGEWFEHSTNMFTLAVIPALLILVESDVRRSVPLVWIGTVSLFAVTSFFAGSLSLVVGFVGGVLLMTAARLYYPIMVLKRVEQPWSDLQ